MKASFQLENNHDTVTAGENLSGCLSLDLPKTITGCRRIAIHFRGKEEVGVVVGVGKNRRLHGEKERFLDLAIPIEDRHNNIAGPGAYTIPFSVRLPRDIPSSAQCGDHKASWSQDHASIRYSLKATLVGSKHEAKHEVRVLAAAKSTQPPQPCYLLPTAQQVTKNGGIVSSHKGNMYCGAKIHQSQYTRGQGPRVTVCVINDSAASLHNVEAGVEQVVAFTAKGTSSSRSYRLVRAKCALPAGYAPKVDEKTRVQRFNSPTTKAQNVADIQKALTNTSSGGGALSFSIPAIPHSALDTQSTSRIRISHNLVLTLRTEGNKSNPTFRVPIRIVGQGPSNSTSTAAPAAAAGSNSHYITVGPKTRPQSTFNTGAIKLF